MAYKETVLFSGNGQNGVQTFTLTDIPTNYDRIRVNYANYDCFNTAYINTTSWNTIDSKAQPFMCEEFIPSSRPSVCLQNVIWGNLTTATAGTLQRSCSLTSGCKTTAWNMYINKTGVQNTGTYKSNGMYSCIESIIGINYNQDDVEPTKRKLLYDIGDMYGTSSFTIKNYVSAYDRIGFICNVKPYSYTSGSKYKSQYSIARYQEVPSWYLMRNNNFLATNDILVSAPTGNFMHCISIYSGCSGLNWTQINGFNTTEGTNTASADDRTCSIHKIIGIKL